MKPSARTVLLCALGLAIPTCEALGQSYPTRPIRLIVAFAPGGSLDVLARLMGQKLTEAWGRQVVIDNRPGAGGNMSAELAARAAPDGYTIYMTSAALVANASLYRSIPYDPIVDFSPITLLASAQSVLVVYAGLPVKSVKELIAFGRRAPGKIMYASPGAGSSGHLTMELFKSMAAVELTHVPYKTMGQAQSDLVGGQVAVAFFTIPGAMPYIKSGRMLPLAVSGARRSPALPDVPTVAEAGVPGYEASTWYPALAPAGTPKAIVDKLNQQLVASVRAADMQERFMALGVDPIGSSPEELARHIRAELPKWAKVIRDSGARVDQ